MILVDTSQIVHASIHAAGASGSSIPALPLARKLLWGMLRGYRRKFRAEYGELVLCCDTAPSWRHEVFPHYKAKRLNGSDRQEFHDVLRTLLNELHVYAPYKCLVVPKAEGDDIIASLAIHYCPSEKILILSEDKDFLQLQCWPNIVQYYQRRKAWAPTSIDAEKARREFIIRGDAGDGVPNCLSADDTFVTRGKKQTALKASLVEQWLSLPDESSSHPFTLDGYLRNKQLVDFMSIPSIIRDAAVTTYIETVPAERRHLFTFFVEQRLGSLLSDIGDF
jgi:hypothetical protein